MESTWYLETSRDVLRTTTATRTWRMLVTLCHSAYYQSFAVICCLHLQGYRVSRRGNRFLQNDGNSVSLHNRKDLKSLYNRSDYWTLHQCGKCKLHLYTPVVTEEMNNVITYVPRWQSICLNFLRTGFSGAVLCTRERSLGLPKSRKFLHEASARNYGNWRRIYQVSPI